MIQSILFGLEVGTDVQVVMRHVARGVVIKIFINQYTLRWGPMSKSVMGLHVVVLVVLIVLVIVFIVLVVVLLVSAVLEEEEQSLASLG